MAFRAIVQVLRVCRYKVSCATADESAARVSGKEWPEQAHHLRNTGDRNPRASSVFPAAPGKTSGQSGTSVLVLCPA